MTDSSGSRWSEYLARLDRVIDYIHDHLDERLDLNRLAEVACLSPYHWHRIYHGMVGETVAATVRRLRLHRAAGQLVRSEATLKEIAGVCGFHSVQSFSRAFRAAFGMRPAEYRARGSHIVFSPERKDPPFKMYEVTIREIPKATAFTCLHTGAYMEISRAFDHLGSWLAAHDALQPGTRMIAIYYDDPAVVPEPELRSRAGFILPQGHPADAPFEQTEIPGGTYAVLRHKGPYAGLLRAYQWLYGQWLPQSERETANVPVFEEYLNTPRDTAPPDLLTDICLPLH